MADELQARFAERDAALAETQAALAVRDQFLSVAAHELRTPLTALKGQVQMAQRRLARGGDPAAAEAMLTRAEMQVDRLGGLINDLLDVARISAGGFLVELEPVAPAPLIRRVVETERLMAPGRRIDLDLPRALPVIRADEARLEQVLLNLLENARKYSPDGSPIRIDADTRDGWLEISVQDHGAGIPPEEQRAIFDRLDRKSTR